MKSQSELHNVDAVPWTEIPATSTTARGKGVVEKLLSIDPNNPDNHTRLVRLPKGFRGAATLTHPFWEEVYIVKGKLVDLLNNNAVYDEGYYCCRQPGMPHGPFACPNEECMCYEIHYMPKD